MPWSSEVDWPCEVVRDFADENLGLKRRIPSGLDRVFAEVEEAIILEDDCLPHPSFFPYCEELLERYRDDERVVHISGSQLLPRAAGRGELPLLPLRAYLGLGDLAARLAPLRRRPARLARADEGASAGPGCGGCSRSEAERRYWQFVWDHSPEIDNWDAQWSYVCLSRGLLSVNPNSNLISNIGFGDEATNATDDPLGIGGPPAGGDLLSARASSRGAPRRRRRRVRVPALQAAEAGALAARRLRRPAGRRAGARPRAGADPPEDPPPGPGRSG